MQELTAASMQSKQAASPDPCMQGWACTQSDVYLCYGVCATGGVPLPADSCAGISCIACLVHDWQSGATGREGGACRLQ
jgi:hypothetical protein